METVEPVDENRGLMGNSAAPKLAGAFPALGDTAFEKHYRIGDLAKLWGLGRESVRKLVKDDPGGQNPNGTEEGSHDLQRPGIHSASNTHALAELTLISPARNNDQLGLRLIVKGFPENLGKPCLTLGNPSGVMFPDRVLVVAQKVGDVGDGHAALKQNARESVPEAVRRRLLVERPSQLKHPLYPAPPCVCHRFQAP